MRRHLRTATAIIAVAVSAVVPTAAGDAPDAPPASKPRARELGITPLVGGRAGALDAITDVAGVEVGHTTLIEGEGRLVVGRGPVRTGVTIVHPRGKSNADPVFGAWFTLNGNGEMTGTTWLEESGILEGPVAITNTHSVGVVRDAILQWQVSRPGLQPWGLPVVAETYDGTLNDINGFHVKPAHVFGALDKAASGPVDEGNVGGGTGMRCLGFKGGIGTASRLVAAEAGGYTVGVLVQCNFGLRQDLRVAGVPVGEEIGDIGACVASEDPAIKPGMPRCGKSSPGPSPKASKGSSGSTSSTNSLGSTGSSGSRGSSGSTTGSMGSRFGDEEGSIIVVVATDAPLLPHQLKRIATRVALGVGRTGGFGGNGSGDIFLAFSTANAKAAQDEGVRQIQMLPNARMNALFYASVQATEEAILNAMLAAETMTGADSVRVPALPHDRLLAALRKHGRLR